MKKPRFDAGAGMGLGRQPRQRLRLWPVAAKIAPGGCPGRPGRDLFFDNRADWFILREGDLRFEHEPALLPQTGLPKILTMHKNPYKRFSQAELILRDELAIDRTILANERTLLSYLRGALTLVIAGVSIVHFVPAGVLYWVGLSLVPVGVVSGVFGTLRYRKMNRRIRAIREGIEHKEGIKTEPKPEPPAGSAR